MSGWFGTHRQEAAAAGRKGSEKCAANRRKRPDDYQRGYKAGYEMGRARMLRWMLGDSVLARRLAQMGLDPRERQRSGDEA